MESQPREQLPPPSEPSAEAVRRVASRLEELSVPQAERILERAIELETAAPGPGPSASMSAEMLAQVAHELGIGVDSLRQAMAEELFRVEVPVGRATLVDRLVAPRSLAVHGPVAGGESEVRDIVDAWMTGHEGLRMRADRGGSVTWERDRSFGATVNIHLGTKASPGTLRSARKVVSTVRPATDDQQVVLVEADVGNIRATSLVLLAASAGVAGLTAGIVAAAGAGNVATAASGAATFGVLGGTAHLSMRMWLRQMRDGLQRVLDAVRSPQVMGGPDLPLGLDRVRGMFFKRW